MNKEVLEYLSQIASKTGKVDSEAKNGRFSGRRRKTYLLVFETWTEGFRDYKTWQETIEGYRDARERRSIVLASQPAGLFGCCALRSTENARIYRGELIDAPTVGHDGMLISGVASRR